MLPMRPSVRPALAALAAALLLAASADAQPRRTQPGRPAPVARVASPTIAAGPMNGYSLHREVAVWVQTTAAAPVQIRYWNEATPAARTTTPAVEATADEAFAAHVVIDGLEPGQTYGYEVLVGGRVVARPYALRFSTQPLWQWRTDPPAFTFALGSCAYDNEPAYDRPGTPYGKDPAIFRSIAALRPAFMLWTGDNTYLREVDWWSERGMNHRYSHARATPEMQPLLGTTHHYATWDDHDYGPNDADRSWVLKDEALDVFKRFWANVSYGLPGVGGVFGHFEHGDAAFFLLDDRTHRSPNAVANDDPSKTMFGREQLTWLLDALATSRAPFKFVVSGGQIVNPVPVYETMATFAAERQFLLDELARRRISGVVFLTGDRHMTELQRLDRPGGPPLYDFTSSSLTAGPARRAPAEMDTPTRVAGTLVEGENNFGTVTVEGPRTARTATLRTYGADGALKWEVKIAAADLAWPDAR